MTRRRRALCVAVVLLLTAWEADVAGNTNLGVSLYYSDAWNHARSYVRDTVKASWGLRDEGDALGASRCNAQLDNRTGSYSPDDARSPLYGLIGRNTPGRVALTPGFSSGPLADQVDTFTRTASSTWGTDDSGYAWSQFGVGGTVNASDWNVAGGFGTQSVPAVDAFRFNYLADIRVRDVDVAVTFKVAQATGDNLEPANIILRATSTTSYVLVRVTVDPSNHVALKVYSALTEVLGTATVAGLTHAGTGTPLRVRAKAAGSRIYARVWNPAGAEPTTWDLIVTDPSAPISGWIGVRSGIAHENTNTKPVVFSYDNLAVTTEVTVADGAVSSWEPDRAPGNDNNAWTDIAITGPSQRVNASKSVQSALRRTLAARIAAGTGPEAYWPLEDGPNTLLAQSAVPGIPGMNVYQAVSTITPGIVKFGEGTAPPGSRPVIDLTGGGSLRAILPDNGTFVDRWAIDWVSTFPLGGQDVDGGSPGTMLTIISDSASIGYMQTDAGFNWRLFYGTTSAFSGRAIGVGTGLPTPYDDGLPHHYRITAVQSGADVDITLWYDGVNVGVGGDFSDDGLPTATLGRIKEIHVNDATPDGGSWQPSLGQLVVWYGNPPDMATVAAGYPGETCADRFTRLLAEHNIPGAVYGSGSHPMGPQFPDTLPNLLGEIARTDMGMIYDGRGWNGLEFRTGASLRNQSAALALTFGEGGDVHTPLRPVTDDLGLTNDVTANKREGPSAHVERTTGPNNVNDPVDDPDGIGRQESTTDVNPENDEDLRDIAGWSLHVGTWPGTRYKNVTIDLSKHPELLQAAIGIRPGDLITIDELDADQVELLVLGGTDTVPTHDHRVTFNCIPAGPHRIGQVATAGFMRIGSASSTLAADFDAGTDTSMSVAVAAGGALWSTTAPPFHIRVGGVVLNVTAISGASSPQTFTVDATPVNGITRTLRTTDPAALTRVNIEKPVYVGA